VELSKRDLALLAIPEGNGFRSQSWGLTYRWGGKRALGVDDHTERARYMETGVFRLSVRDEALVLIVSRSSVLEVQCLLRRVLLFTLPRAS
jgi:hypothetical protein